MLLRGTLPCCGLPSSQKCVPSSAKHCIISSRARSHLLNPSVGTPSKWTQPAPRTTRSTSICNSVAPTSPEAAAAPASKLSRGPGWKVHKFGGTCMAAAERIDAASKLMINIDAEATGKLAIVSAMGSHPTSPLKVSIYPQYSGSTLLPLTSSPLEAKLKLSMQTEAGF